MVVFLCKIRYPNYNKSCTCRGSSRHQQTECLCWGDWSTNPMSRRWEDNRGPNMDDHRVRRVSVKTPDVVPVQERREWDHWMGPGIQCHSAPEPYCCHWSAKGIPVLSTIRLQSCSLWGWRSVHVFIWRPRQAGETQEVFHVRGFHRSKFVLFYLKRRHEWR